MSKYIPGNQKHLTLNDRLYIENELAKGTPFKDIAAFLCKDPTTISKEVRAHRISDWYHKGTFYNAKNFCIHRFHCKKTNACGKILRCGIKCASCPTCNQTCNIYISPLLQEHNKRLTSGRQNRCFEVLFAYADSNSSGSSASPSLGRTTASLASVFVRCTRLR